MTDLTQKELDTILLYVKMYKGIDFTNYAQGSLKRRIIRFFGVKRLNGINEFESRIKKENEFADDFIDEVTVNVTEMFRDPGFWIYLRNSVLPQLAERPLINIWHAACSTGEEVYSMGILLKEAGISNFKMVATDLNKSALNHAQKGIYKLKNQELNNRNYRQFNGAKELTDYYKIEGNNVIYDSSLIQNVEFKKHNLVNDKSFATYDLIICRNVLIYFNFELQEKVLSLFCDSMHIGSFLGIGSKESISWTKSEKFFNTESLEEKIFKKVK